MIVGVCQTPVLTSEDACLALVRRAAGHAGTLSREGWDGFPPLFLLPEVFFGGFDYPARESWAERSRGLLPELHGLCRTLGVGAAGTFWDKRSDSLLNTMYLLDPSRDEPLAVYSKRHLFPLSEEDRWFTPGGDAPVPLDYHGLRMGFAICFELRFPEHFRILAAADVDFVAVSSQWPLARKKHLDILAQARAVENQCFLLSANACGPSPYGDLAGSSRLAAPTGDVVFHEGSEEACVCAELPMALLDKARSRFDTRRSPVYRVASL